MASLSRRSLLGLGAGMGSLEAVRAAVKPVRITDIDLFRSTFP